MAATASTKPLMVMPELRSALPVDVIDAQPRRVRCHRSQHADRRSRWCDDVANSGRECSETSVLEALCRRFQSDDHGLEPECLVHAEQRIVIVGKVVPEDVNRIDQLLIAIREVVVRRDDLDRVLVKTTGSAGDLTTDRTARRICTRTLAHAGTSR